MYRLTLEFDIVYDLLFAVGEASHDSDNAQAIIKDALIKAIKDGDYDWEIERIIEDITAE